MRDYVDWHRSYDDAGSSLSRRLEVVRRRLHQALDALVGEEVRVLSLCAGDGRDILDVVARRGGEEPSVVLAEKDPRLAADAAKRAAAHGLSRVVVVEGDAGDPLTWLEHVPVDLLVLCGIFGNITDVDIRQTIVSIPAMLREEGHVVWTRGADGDLDLRPQVRKWFADAGFAEIAFDGSPEPFGVGLNVRSPAAGCRELPPRLFSFIR